MPKRPLTRTNSDRPRRVGPEDEDRQSQLDDGKRETVEDVLKDGGRRAPEEAAGDTDCGGLPRR